MDASWRPSLNARSYYPQSKAVEDGLGNKLVRRGRLPCTEGALVRRGCLEVSSEVTPAGSHSRRVWGPKSASPSQDVTVIEDQRAKSPEPQATAYGKEELLIVRQRMLDNGSMRKWKRMQANGMLGNGELMCKEVRVSDAEPSGKPSKKLSTDSECSTTDTLSDTSEEHDVTLSLTESPVVALPVTLRASAPEFVPHVSTSAPCLEQHVNAPIPQQVLSSTPVWRAAIAPFPHGANSGFLCGGSLWGQGSSHHGSSTVFGLFPASLTSCMQEPPKVDVLEAASQRYVEWRKYCGLTTTMHDGIPHSFQSRDAHGCSVADLFAFAKPGELFACSGA